MDITSIGLKIGIASETEGTMPTTGYKAIPKVYEIPELDFDPDTIETTTFDNLKYKSYADGLMDTGGVLSFTANYTKEGVELWDQYAEAEEGTSGKKSWIVIAIKNVDTKYFIPANIIPTGVPNAPINDRVSIGLKFTVTGDIVKKEATDSTLFAS